MLIQKVEVMIEQAVTSLSCASIDFRKVEKAVVECRLSEYGNGVA